MQLTLASTTTVKNTFAHWTSRVFALPALRLITAALPGVVVTVVAGCSAPRPPYVPPSQGHIMAPEPKAQIIPQDIPPPARISTFVPPPKPAVKPLTYSVVVHEVPVKELLLALSRDTRQNIDVHPGINGLVSLNAINETLPAILERVSKQVNMRYRVEGNTILVSPDSSFMKTYRIPYVNMTRDTTSTVNVSGEISAGGSTASSGGGSTGVGGSGTQVRTVSNNDFWKILTENIRSIVTATRNQAQSAEERSRRAELTKNAREERLQQAEVVARAGAGANNLFTTAFGASPAQQAIEGRDDIVVNSVGGTISVLATERQHQLIQQHIDSVTNSVQRQVLIEATIVEVKLSNTYQGGIDWSRLAIGGGIQLTQSLLTGFGAAGAAVGLTQAGANLFQVRYANPNSPIGNISSTVKLLEEFGDTKILSSPKLMALNNQTALLKVVDNIVYFEVQGSTVPGTANSAPISTFTSTAKVVSVGLVMGVTPQISDDGRVSLNVRPTISRVLRFRNDPNPGLCDPNRLNCVQSQVPEVQVREMESVLQIASGQTVILGGLMQDDVRFNREQIPGADLLGAAGDIARFRNENASKTELIIFLRPTVITNASLDSDELKMFRRYLPQPEQSQTPQATGNAP
jgi:MSHA type pilus biogenesis protein MshL